MPKFYKNPLHFGFTIAGSMCDLRLNTRPNSQLPDTLIMSNKDTTRYYIRTIYTQPGAGFAIGLVADFRLHEYIRLRCTPSVAPFASKKIEYRLSTVGRDTFKVYKKTIEPVYIFLPIEAKIQSKRLGNFSTYVIGGYGYALDLTSRKKAAGVVGPNELESNIKLKRDDFYYSAGAGTDFYLMYFKLGLEIKLQVGTRNMLNPSNNIFSNSIDKIRSRMVVFTVTFEG